MYPVRWYREAVLPNPQDKEHGPDPLSPPALRIGATVFDSFDEIAATAVSIACRSPGGRKSLQSHCEADGGTSAEPNGAGRDNGWLPGDTAGLGGVCARSPYDPAGAAPRPAPAAARDA